MKTTPIVASSKRSLRCVTKPRRTQPESPKSELALQGRDDPDIKPNLLHDLVNQLTIIGLACFEIRTPECELWSDSQRKAIEAVETAVQNAGEFAVQLAKAFEAESSIKARDLAPTRSLPVNNVYPISPFLTQR